jgi:hypothetical protein
VLVVGLGLLATSCGDPSAIPSGDLPTLTLTGTSTQLPPGENDGVALKARSSFGMHANAGCRSFCRTALFMTGSGCHQPGRYSGPTRFRS